MQFLCKCEIEVLFISDTLFFEQYLITRDGMIVVAECEKNSESVIKQMEIRGLRQGVDFWMYQEFITYILPIVMAYIYDKLYISLAQISLTERCTLKCRKCAHGCYAVDNKKSKDLTLEQVYKSFDIFFKKVDFVKKFVVLGGEPFLYKNLDQVVYYLGVNYRSQIGICSIVTNGTIIPNDKILGICKKFNISIQISNYTYQIPRLKRNIHLLISELKKKNVLYSFREKEKMWSDYGFDYVNRNADTEELIRVFDACKTPCREIRENRLYYCIMARSVSDNLGYRIGTEDYLDLNSLEGEGYKKEILEFTLGYSEKGYLDMCNRCHGAERGNWPIPAAEQIVEV